MTDKTPAFTGRIAIVGSGAIGCYYGGRLAQHGHDVHFLMRSDLDTVRATGLEVRSWQGDFHLTDVQCAGTPEEIGPCDMVIVALKSTSNSSLRTLLPALLHEKTAILTLQNGMGNEQLLAAEFGEERVLGGLCFVCINRLESGVIDHTAQGHISLGEFNRVPQARTHAIAAALVESGVPCTVEDSLMLARWRKLVWNIPFNGLSIAAGGLDTAQILADEGLEALVKALMLEVIAAAREMGHELPDSIADSMIQNTREMAGYKTSSLLDWLAGREVEINAIWAEPCRLAREAGVPVPKIEMLLQLLRPLCHYQRGMHIPVS